MRLNLYTDEAGTLATLYEGSELMAEEVLPNEANAKAWAYAKLDGVLDEYAPVMESRTTVYEYVKVANND